MKLQTHSHGWGFRNLLVFALIFQVRKARLRKSRDLPKATWVDRAELRLGLVTLSSVPFLLPQGWRGLQGPAQRWHFLHQAPLPGKSAAHSRATFDMGRNIKSGIRPECGTQPSSGGGGGWGRPPCQDQRTALGPVLGFIPCPASKGGLETPYC